MRLVVFGWGNDSRGDDGLGPILLTRIAGAGWPKVRTIEDFQLQIEHALDLEGADLALFLDAGQDTPPPFAFLEIKPQRIAAHTTHALAPDAVLDIYARTLRLPPPPSFSLCMRGERFDLGEGLSAAASERLEAAWEFVRDLMRDCTVERWCRFASMQTGPGPDPHSSPHSRTNV